MASFNSSNANTRSTTGCNWCWAIARTIASKPSRWPTVTPCRRTWRVMIDPSDAAIAPPERMPIIATVPPGRTQRSDCGSVFSPPSSRIRS